MKKMIDTKEAIEMVSPGILTMVSSQGEGSAAPNLITVAWCMPLSKRPPLVAIAVSQRSYSQQLIREGKEFVLNVVSAQRIPEAVRVGSSTGRQINKFAELGLTPEATEIVQPPAVAEALGWLECRVVQEIPVGDHYLFVGEILSAQAEEDLFDGYWKVSPQMERRPLVYWGGPYYVLPEERRLFKDRC